MPKGSTQALVPIGLPGTSLLGHLAGYEGLTSVSQIPRVLMLVSGMIVEGWDGIQEA